MSPGSSRSCAHRAHGWSRRPTPSDGDSNAISTTAPRPASSRSRCCSTTRADGRQRRRTKSPLLDEAVEELKTGLAELRELARGIHPAVLTEQGLGVAIESLAARASVPLTVDSDLGERLPEPIEAAAYFAVSEALANVAKYSQATQASVAVRRSNGRVTVDVADDGIGGADPVRGSGLTGLADRVAALDGTLSVDSPPGGGTRLHIELPV